MPRIRKMISKQRIDKRRKDRSGREDDEAAEQQRHQNDRKQPILLAQLEELPELSQKVHNRRLRTAVSSYAVRDRAFPARSNSSHDPALAPGPADLVS